MGGKDEDRSRVWVVSELYYPEDTSTGYYLTRIAEGLATEYAVRVLCAQPTYAARGHKAPVHEIRNGVVIRRCWSTTLNKDVLPLRLINLLTISLSVFLQALWRFRRGDRVLVVTNPPLLPFVVWFASRLKGGQCALLIHDVYPDLLIATGMLHRNSLAARLMDRATVWLYRSVWQIIAIGRDMAELARRKLGKGDYRVTVIQNWADSDLVQPRPRESVRILEQFGLVNKFVVQYSGNMGRTHNLEAVIECAKQLRGKMDIHFLLVGFGARRPWLDEEVKRSGLPNVTVADRQQREDLPALLAAADVAVISLIPGMAGVSVPSRFYNILASACPPIALVDTNSELALTIAEERIGWVVPADHPERLRTAVLEAYSQRSSLREMGRRARQVAETRFAYEHIALAYRTAMRHPAGTVSMHADQREATKARAA